MAGLETGWAEVMYAGCDGSSGDCLSKEEMLVMLLPATDRAMEDAYEFCLTLDALDDRDPWLG